MLRAATVWCCALVLAAGCREESSEKEAAGSSSPPTLVDEGEERRLKERLDAEVERNRERRCPRPPLRGEARSGPADEDMIALIDGDGPLAACYRAVKKADEKGALFPEGADELPPLSASPPAALREIEERCDELPALLSRAVSHEDSCSPFLPGRRGQMGLVSVIRAGKAAVVLARARARAGEARAAAELLLDVTRFGQDLGRGGTSLIEPMIGTAALHQVLPHLSAIAESEALEEEDLEALEAQLGRLLESQVPPSSIYRGERLHMALYMLRPALEEAGWEPPGGFPNDMEPREEGQSPGERLGMANFGARERQGIVLAWVAVEKLASAWKSACPDDAAWKSCVQGIEDVAEELAGEAGSGVTEALAELMGRPAKELREEDVRRTVREEVITILESMTASAVPKYFRRLAWQEAALLALRAKIRARLGGCPGEPPSGDLGAPLGLSPAGEETYRLEAPSFAAYRSGEDEEESSDQTLLRLRCK